MDKRINLLGPKLIKKELAKFDHAIRLNFVNSVAPLFSRTDQTCFGKEKKLLRNRRSADIEFFRKHGD